MMQYDALIEAYEADVQCPDVSGMEHLDMLLKRSEIEKMTPHLSDIMRQRVLNADRVLVQHARQFYEAIQSIADLVSWRRSELAPVTHWWWYLDVITHLPIQQAIRAPTLNLVYERDGGNAYKVEKRNTPEINGETQ